ncbi:MAG: TonB-dependent receptor [Bacteroidales bacterium]|jgi:TonB-linked SusC/RagA family outer membrane protein|nr:TonB-dependent receptor [Bacteroidales bacterium]
MMKNSSNESRIACKYPGRRRNFRQAGMIVFCYLFFTAGLFAADTDAAPPDGMDGNGVEGVLQTNKKQISGTVVDENGEAVIGANVIEKGVSSNGTITDVNGNFSLNVSDGATLQVSYIGYITQEIPTGSRNRFDIRLEEDTRLLEEVVVVGYGTQKKVSVTGAVASVQTKDLRQSSAANLSSALAGRLPGLTALQTSGQPGNDNVNLYLRGRGTLNGSDPLIMIDGVPRDNISTLDPNEIESVSILKDASATAVFGVRGANGVIMITTRRGTAGKTELSVTADYSLQSFIVKADRNHSWEFAELRNQAARNSGTAEANLPYTPYMIEKYKEGGDPFYPDRDVFHDFFHDYAPQTRVNMNLSGGSDDLLYFLNTGYVGQGGQFKTESKDYLGYDPSYRMDRYSFRGNVDYKMAKNLKVSLNLASYLEKMNSPQTRDLFSDNMESMVTNMIAYLWATPPTDPGPVTAEGYGVPGNQVLNQSGQDRNIYGEVNRRGYRQETNTMLNSSLTIDWGLDFITKGLSTKFMASFDAKARTIIQGVRSYDCYSWSVARSADEESSYGVIRGNQDESIHLYKNMNTYYYSNFQYSLNYARQFDGHDVTALALFQRDNWEKNDYSAQLPFNMIGMVGRVTYGYGGRYLAEVNVGYNGSEQFAPKNRFGFFPAFSGGWVISEEGFLKNNKTLTHLKLRASYGEVGNDKLGGARFLYLSDIKEGGGPVASLGYGKGISQGLMGNEYLQWEVAHKQNYGLDVQFLKSLSLNFDVYREKRDHILISRGTVPELQGVPLGNIPKVNMAQVDNRGYEVELTWQKQLNRDLHVTLKGNYAYNENKQILVDEPALGEDYAYRYRSTGYSIGQPFGYLIDYSNGNGYINTQEELDALPTYNVGGVPRLGDFKYVDVNEDGEINEKDMAPIGYSEIPRISYGLSGAITYKQFDLSFLFSGIARSNRANAGWGATEFALAGFYSGWHKKAWTAERYANGEEILYPALSTAAGSSQKANSVFIMDRSFLRLKNMEIGYTLPERWTRPIGISRTRIYVNGNNLLTWKEYPIDTIDPEQANALSYPITRMVNFGINVVF